jgi:hypothetical protein
MAYGYASSSFRIQMQRWCTVHVLLSLDRWELCVMASSGMYRD